MARGAHRLDREDAVGVLHVPGRVRRGGDGVHVQDKLRRRAVVDARQADASGIDRLPQQLADVVNLPALLLVDSVGRELLEHRRDATEVEDVRDRGRREVGHVAGRVHELKLGVLTATGRGCQRGLAGV